MTRPVADIKLDIDALSDAARARRESALKKPPPIPCKGHWDHTQDGSDYDCDYANAGAFGCEDCIINGGAMDPRTGKRFARRRRKP